MGLNNTNSKSSHLESHNSVDAEKQNGIEVTSIVSTDASKHELIASEVEIPFKQKLRLFFSAKPPRDSEIKEPFRLWTPAGQSSYETKLVFKLDCLLLTYVCLSFFIRYLDASNISNAYVSGMKEDLDMHGTMYNWLTRAFYISYSIFGLPITLLITKVKPHILLPLIEVLWGIMVLLTIACNSYKSIMVVRIIEGGLEGACFPIIHYLLGSWYNRKELTTRTSLFIASGALGTMFGGYIQSGVYRTLNGKAGLPGWKWIFVIDFILTIPVAILGYFIIPDTPHQAKPSRFLTQEDIEYCKKRVRVSEKIQSDHTNKWGILKKLVTSWQFYIFTLFYTLCHLPSEATSYWAIVLKAQGYNVYQRNNYPTIQSAVAVVTTVVAGIYVDARGVKWDGLLIIHAIWIFGLAVLVKWDVPRALQFVAYSTGGLGSAASSVVCSWANEMTREDTQLRAAVLGSLNLVLNGPSTAFSIVAFDTDYAPEFTKGTRVSLGLLIASCVFIFVSISFDRYQRRKRDFIDDQIGGEISYSTPEIISN